MTEWHQWGPAGHTLAQVHESYKVRGIKQMMTSHVAHISDAGAKLDDTALSSEAPPVEPALLAESQIAFASCVAACVEASQMVNKTECRTSVVKAKTRASEFSLITKVLTPSSLRRWAENAVVSLSVSCRSSLVVAHLVASLQLRSVAGVPLSRGRELAPAFVSLVWHGRSFIRRSEEVKHELTTSMNITCSSLEVCLCILVSAKSVRPCKSTSTNLL